MKLKLRIILTVLIILVTQSLMAQSKGKTVYPLVMSFQSQCCGVPSDSALRKFIESFKKQYKIKKITAYHIGPMGREGEYYLAFKLNELSKKQVSIFISKIKKIEKLPSDKGQWSFQEKEEIDQASLQGRAKTKEVVF